MPDFLWPILQFLLPCSLLLGFVLAVMLPGMLWMERKVSAYIQDRRGPNRAHVLGLRLFGLFHPLADAIKLLAKEDAEPDAAHKSLFRLAPFLVVGAALMSLAVLPFGPPIEIAGRSLPLHLQIAPLNAGLLYVFAFTGLGVYGVLLAGWSSGNRFALMGALRAASQMISFKIGLGLSVVGILAAYGTTDLVQMVARQGVHPWSWGVWVSPLGFLLFVGCLFAETYRNPFDAPTAPELVAGYHSEYSSLKYALFRLGQYVHLIVGAAVVSTLFFGGWQIPFVTAEALRSHAHGILSGLSLLGGLGLLGLSALLMRAIAHPSIRWQDRRDGEPRLFLVLSLLGGLGLLFVCCWILPEAHIPAWLAVLTQVGLQVAAFVAKTCFSCFVFVWIRWSLPRVRHDQAMRIGWGYFVPLGVANIFLTILWARLWL